MNPSEDLTLNYHMITAIMVISNESIGQFNSNYHMVTAMMVVNCHAKSLGMCSQEKWETNTGFFFFRINYIDNILYKFLEMDSADTRNFLKFK